MELRHIQPQSEILSKHILFFYFLKEDDANFKTQFLAFPHNCKPLNIHRSIDYEISENRVLVKSRDGNLPQILLQGTIEAPLFVRFEGRMDKVTIIFKPLGLAHFINTAYKDVAGKHTQLFEEWEHLPAYHTMLTRFFPTSDEHDRIAVLEEFLLSVYRPLPHYEWMQEAVDRVTNFQEYKTIKEIADGLYVSTKTLNRLFHKHLACSPMTFRKIAQFRHSLENKYILDNFKTLTDLAYGSNVYDLSYLTKIYRSLTLNSPKAFFKSVQTKCDQKIVLQFLK